MIVLMSTGYWGIILGVASIAIAILIYFLQKQIRYPGQLKFAIIETWKVRSTSPNGYGELSLKYNDYEIKEELNYVKFILYNKKSFDYSSGDTNNPVRIILPEGCRWVDAKVIDHSKEVQAAVTNKNGKELGLTFELLRKNEYVEVDGIIESINSLNSLGDAITILHRIPNVSSVKHTPLLNSYDYQRAKSNSILLGVLLVMVVLVLIYALGIHPASPLKFKELSTGEIRSLYIEKDGGVVYHKGMFIWSGYSDPISQDDFAKEYVPCFDSPKLENTDFFYITFFSIIIILLTYLTSGWVSSLRRSNEIKRIMK